MTEGQAVVAVAVGLFAAFPFVYLARLSLRQYRAFGRGDDVDAPFADSDDPFGRPLSGLGAFLRSNAERQRREKSELRQPGGED